MVTYKYDSAAEKAPRR